MVTILTGEKHQWCEKDQEQHEQKVHVDYLRLGAVLNGCGPRLPLSAEDAKTSRSKKG